MGAYHIFGSTLADKLGLLDQASKMGRIPPKFLTCTFVLFALLYQNEAWQPKLSLNFTLFLREPEGRNDFYPSVRFSEKFVWGCQLPFMIFPTIVV